MSSNYELDELNLFYKQIFISVLLIITVLISITLSYNEILKIQNKKQIYTGNQEIVILLIGRCLSVLIAVGFLLINITEKNNNKQKNIKDIKHTNLQIDASILNLLASLIVLYIAYDSINDITPSDITNPEL